MLQLKREYLGFTLNTATSDAQIKKIGSDKSTSDYAHGINKKKTEVLLSLALTMLHCFIYSTIGWDPQAMLATAAQQERCLFRTVVLFLLLAPLARRGRPY